MTKGVLSQWRERGAIAVVWFLATFLQAADDLPNYDRGSVLVINEENDLFVDTDRHYTQGIRVAYLHEDGRMPLGLASVSRWLPAWGFDLLSGRSGYAVGQNIYTPNNLESPDLELRDRPYAGWLYVGSILQRSGVTPRRLIPVQESWELELGTIGPSSLARQAQTWVHELRGFSVPRGWHHQLRDEPGFRLKIERAYRLSLVPSGGMFGAELLPWGGGVVGTVEDTLRIGGILRVGLFLPNDFGVRTIDSLSTSSGGHSRSAARHWGIHAFVGAEGRLVGRNEFLDGNLYVSSHHVDRRYCVSDLLLGMSATLLPFEFGYVHLFRSPEFGGQTEHNEFGSVFMRILF